ncbi:MAG: hypothetical protein MUC81_05610 [Bacteroidia bacterium]|nr:hypothetical protein [Bacteroidia bacterium]
MSHILLYIDPGSGSILYQLIIAGSIGAIVSFRNYFTGIKTWLGAKFSSKK